MAKCNHMHLCAILVHCILCGNGFALCAALDPVLKWPTKSVRAHCTRNTGTSIQVSIRPHNNILMNTHTHTPAAYSCGCIQCPSIIIVCIRNDSLVSHNDVNDVIEIIKCKRYIHNYKIQYQIHRATIEISMKTFIVCTNASSICHSDYHY